MKILIISLIVVMISACGSDNDQGQIKFNVRSYDIDPAYGGTVDVLRSGYYFTSRTNPDCLPGASCSKADIAYLINQEPVTGRQTRYEFKFRVDQYDFIENPWVIIFQDWLRVYPDDKNGNNPITDFTLQGDGHTLTLIHQDHSGQFYVPMNSERQRVIHGSAIIDIGVEYSLSITIVEGVEKGSGRVTASIDDVVFSDAIYQTKSATEWQSNTVAFGIYHGYNHNLERDPSKQIMLYAGDLVIQR